MEIIFDKICVLVAAAFALTVVPGFTLPERSLLSVWIRIRQVTSLDGGAFAGK